MLRKLILKLNRGLYLKLYRPAIMCKCYACCIGRPESCYIGETRRHEATKSLSDGMPYTNPACLQDGKPCAPNAEGGCNACDYATKSLSDAVAG